MQLFDGFERTDSAYATNAESNYHFLNRSSWTLCARNRGLCEQWFAQYPAKAQRTLRNRFSSDNDDQHSAAYFELLVYELLRNLGGDLELEPTIPHQSGLPDFRATQGGQRFYIEAASSIARGVAYESDRNIQTIIDWINDIPNPDLEVSLSLYGDRLPHTPSRKAVCQPILDLMKRYGSVMLQEVSQTQTNRERPIVTIVLSNELQLTVTLHAKPLEHRGDPTGHTIAAGPGGRVNDVVPSLVNTVKAKAHKHAAAAQDAPLVVALSVIETSFDMRTSPRDLLFGRPHDIGRDGTIVARSGIARQGESVWYGRDGKPRREDLAAVWIFVNAQSTFSTPAGSGNCLFLNPFHDVDLPSDLLRFTHARVLSDKIVKTDGRDFAKFLDIPHIPSRDLEEPPP